VQCSATTNRQCETCGSGFIVVGETACASCNTPDYPKSYANPGQTACLPCRDCSVFQRQKSDCSSQQNRECENCGANQRSLSLNAGSCNGCNQNYIRAANDCVPCDKDNAACDAGYWINCKFNEANGGFRTCDVCQGQRESSGTDRCVAGTGVSQRCTGRDITVTLCAPCAAGTERKDDTPLVDGVFQGCVKCPTGFFKPSTGTAACAGCTNKPANSQYRAWGASETASTSSCPWYVLEVHPWRCGLSELLFLVQDLQCRLPAVRDLVRPV
jgi:hypothetical protein